MLRNNTSVGEIILWRLILVSWWLILVSWCCDMFDIGIISLIFNIKDCDFMKIMFSARSGACIYSFCAATWSIGEIVSHGAVHGETVITIRNCLHVDCGLLIPRWMRWRYWERHGLLPTLPRRWGATHHTLQNEIKKAHIALLFRGHPASTSTSSSIIIRRLPIFSSFLLLCT